MNDIRLGQKLQDYERRVRALRAAASVVPVVEDVLFREFADWERQLLFKLAPRLAGDGCLIVALAGGTNTGKSTLFNSLLGGAVSPVSPFGAFTKRPLLSAGPGRYGQCLEKGKLLPDAFIPKAWEQAQPDDVADENQEAMAVFVAENGVLPDRMVLLDTPDIDSIVQRNWEAAKTIREAGDVIVAVLTGQKYADTVVVEFFREAVRAGRVVAPLMNLADDQSRGYDVTRLQAAEFVRYVTEGVEERAVDVVGPVFVSPRLVNPYDAEPGDVKAVALDDPGLSLMEYLLSLDAVGLKKRILSDNLGRFCGEADRFFSRAEGVADNLNAVAALVERMAHGAALGYVSKPGREVITVVYDFIQHHADGPDRFLGAVTAQAVKLPRLAYQATKALLNKKEGKSVTEQDFSKEQRRQLSEIVGRLYSDYATEGVRSVREWSPEVAALFGDALRAMDPNGVAEEIMVDALRTEDYIAAYREYAYRELEARWCDRTFRWTVKGFYRLGLLGSWAGVLVLLWAHGWAPGLPLSEILASLGVPVFQHSVTHAALYLWGDKLAGLVRKWQVLQQEALEQAILRRLVNPVLGGVRPLAEAITVHVAAMRELNEECRNQI